MSAWTAVFEIPAGLPSGRRSGVYDCVLERRVPSPWLSSSETEKACRSRNRPPPRSAAGDRRSLLLRPRRTPQTGPNREGYARTLPRSRWRRTGNRGLLRTCAESPGVERFHPQAGCSAGRRNRLAHQSPAKIFASDSRRRCLAFDSRAKRRAQLAMLVDSLVCLLRAVYRREY